ncbi:MAG: TraR/DksA C4-type zinc finger protein [Caldilineaceae bacterium]|nr:TraR/DksA C4-type zinc finger protein [Caldilineaceae bacterium]
MSTSATTEFVENERQKLLAEQGQVNEELTHLRELMQAEVDVEPDEGDSEIFEREKNAALIAVLERRLQDIESALKSIDKGEYGICTRCGNPIEVERLEVKPDATMCLRCQQEVERLSRRNRPQRQIDW